MYSKLSSFLILLLLDFMINLSYNSWILMAWIHMKIIPLLPSNSTVCYLQSSHISGLVEVMHEIAQSLQLSQHVALWIFLVASKPSGVIIVTVPTKTLVKVGPHTQVHVRANQTDNNCFSLLLGISLYSLWFANYNQTFHAWLKTYTLNSQSLCKLQSVCKQLVCMYCAITKKPHSSETERSHYSMKFYFVKIFMCEKSHRSKVQVHIE